MIKILIASPYPAMRAGLRVLLDEAPIRAGLSVVAEVGTVAAARDWMRGDRLNVVLYDLAFERGETWDGLWQLRAHNPAARGPAPAPAIIALCEAEDDPRALGALQAGARGCLPKTLTSAELLEAVEAAAAGENILPPATTALLLQQLRGETPQPTLSPREAEVLRGVASGQTNKAIAIKLGISEHTVKFHLGSAMTKLGAGSRAEAVALALRVGLIAV
jgi:DNA-binding NarL/FixJ family response regulator